MERKVSTVSMHAGSGELRASRARRGRTIVVDEERCVIGILTKMDLIEMLAVTRRARPVRRMESGLAGFRLAPAAPLPSA